MRLAPLLLLLTACHTNASRIREQYDCAHTATAAWDMQRCLTDRYGWEWETARRAAINEGNLRGWKY